MHKKWMMVVQEYEQEVESLEQELSLSREKEGVYLTSHKAANRIFTCVDDFLACLDK
jgi:hypothetical protein